MVVYIFLGHSGRKFLCNLTLGIRFLPIFGIIHGIIPGITTLIPEIIPGITTLIPEIIPGITTPIPGIMPGITTPIPGIIPGTSVRKHTSIVGLGYFPVNNDMDKSSLKCRLLFSQEYYLL